jgi:hypothetical protein
MKQIRRRTDETIKEMEAKSRVRDCGSEVSEKAKCGNWMMR